MEYEGEAMKICLRVLAREHRKIHSKNSNDPGINEQQERNVYRTTMLRNSDMYPFLLLSTVPIVRTADAFFFVSSS